MKEIEPKPVTSSGIFQKFKIVEIISWIIGVGSFVGVGGVSLLVPEEYQPLVFKGYTIVLGIGALLNVPNAREGIKQRLVTSTGAKVYDNRKKGILKDVPNSVEEAAQTKLVELSVAELSKLKDVLG